MMGWIGRLVSSMWLLLCGSAASGRCCIGDQWDGYRYRIRNGNGVIVVGIAIEVIAIVSIVRNTRRNDRIE